MLSESEASGSGHFSIDSFIHVGFLQVFMQERFRDYARAPCSITATKGSILDSSKLSSLFKELPLPLCCCWFMLHPVKQWYMGFLIVLEWYFSFRPLVGLHKGFVSSCFNISFSKEHYRLQISSLFEPFGETHLLPPYLVILPWNIPFFLANSKYSFTFYFSHWVHRQFGLDQSISRELSL